ncbi:MAG TPA: hypothetical protein VFF84_08685 [Sphingobium sp.]|nr:hypothetical protein [Sphingobium sp.]
MALWSRASRLDVINLALGGIFAVAPKVNEALLKLAVAAAKAALPAWSWGSRAAALEALAAALEPRMTEFAG